MATFSEPGNKFLAPHLYTTRKSGWHGMVWAWTWHGMMMSDMAWYGARWRDNHMGMVWMGVEAWQCMAGILAECSESSRKTLNLLASWGFRLFMLGHGEQIWKAPLIEIFRKLEAMVVVGFVSFWCLVVILATLPGHLALALPKSHLCSWFMVAYPVSRGLVVGIICQWLVASSW